jgi:hypothetical protein
MPNTTTFKLTVNHVLIFKNILEQSKKDEQNLSIIVDAIIYRWYICKFWAFKTRSLLSAAYLNRINDPVLKV